MSVICGLLLGEIPGEDLLALEGAFSERGHIFRHVNTVQEGDHEAVMQEILAESDVVMFITTADPLSRFGLFAIERALQHHKREGRPIIVPVAHGGGEPRFELMSFVRLSWNNLGSGGIVERIHGFLERRDFSWIINEGDYVYHKLL